ncbi:MAG TPA: penicillin-binding protein 1C [Polyangiaceae bacterium]|nr:penicillin-binding protein 1C [Polyangiaceae bacterium]
MRYLPVLRRTKQIIQSALRVAGLAIAAVVLLTAAAVVFEPLPRALAERRLGNGLWVLDASGKALGQLRDSEYRIALPVRLSDVPTDVRRAVVAAEDARFFRHRGADPLAVARATWQLLTARRIVSGASTLTQQLARTLVPRPRTLFGKWRELVVSLRIEAELSKDEILEAYLSRIPFGPTTQGIAAAAEEYWGKPVSALSLAEGAALASLPKGPTLYHPRLHQARLLARRNRVLSRMVELGWAASDAARRAQLEPIVLHSSGGERRALHFIQAIGNAHFSLNAESIRTATRVWTTIDGELQGRIEKIVSDAKGDLLRVGASAAAVVVLDNARAEVVAYVGSVDFFDRASLGQNDGCLALRQPGSALKPFVYAAGIEGLRMGPATQLFDVETEFATKAGSFVPRNYDGKYHGPVLLRDALGSSLNVPAVAVAERVGVERLLTLLRQLGLRSLDKPGSHYGLALALGDGEVRLLELAEAYSTLARHGLHVPVRTMTAFTNARGERIAIEPAPEVRVLSEQTAWQVLEILADDAARAGAFGRHGALEMPFAAAVKTGTSSNHRDNWAVAVTREVTVAVWVGNFDGRALAHGTSGIVGAGPLLRAATLTAMDGKSPQALFPAERFSVRSTCRASGLLPGPDCPERVDAVFMDGSAPTQRCTLHRKVLTDPRNGLLATPDCRERESRVVEQYPASLNEWARAAGRPLAPLAESPFCPGAVERNSLIAGQLKLKSPESGAHYLSDPHLAPTQQHLVFRTSAPANVTWVIYEVDAASSGRIPAPFRWHWPLQQGAHHVTVTASDGTQDEARYYVD